MNILQEFKVVIGDLCWVYKKLLHFIILKTFIYSWTSIIAVCMMLPFVLLIGIIAFFDPIDWLPILSYAVNGGSIPLGFISSITSNTYWLIVMSLVFVIAFFVLLIGLMYSAVLIAYQAKNFIEQKHISLASALKLNLFLVLLWVFPLLLAWYFFDKKSFVGFFFGEKTHFFSWKLFQNYFFITFRILWYFSLFIIAFISIFFFFYTLQELGFISFEIFSYTLFGVTAFSLLACIYFIFRVMFSYVILAWEFTDKHPWKPQEYIKKSFERTRSLNIWVKFFALIALYMLVLYPFIWYQSFLDRQIERSKTGLLFYNGYYNALQQTNPSQYEYLQTLFSDKTPEDILSTLQSYSRKALIVSIIKYILFSWMSVVIVSSFYIRVMQKK